eukprot:1724273-Rhodomonas_salina.1
MAWHLKHTLQVIPKNAKDVPKPTLSSVCSATQVSGICFCIVPAIEWHALQSGTDTLLPRYQELYLNRCSWLRDDAVLLISGGCRRLSKLGLSECVNITQEGLSGIKFCLALTELDISMNDFVTDETVRQLVDALPQLAAIDLSACE